MTALLVQNHCTPFSFNVGSSWPPPGYFPPAALMHFKLHIHAGRSPWWTYCVTLAVLKVGQLSRLEWNQFLGSAGISSSARTDRRFPHVSQRISAIAATVAHHVCRTSSMIHGGAEQTVDNFLLHRILESQIYATLPLYLFFCHIRDIVIDMRI